MYIYIYIYIYTHSLSCMSPAKSKRRVAKARVSSAPKCGLSRPRGAILKAQGPQGLGSFSRLSFKIDCTPQGPDEINLASMHRLRGWHGGSYLYLGTSTVLWWLRKSYASLYASGVCFCWWPKRRFEGDKLSRWEAVRERFVNAWSWCLWRQETCLLATDSSWMPVRKTATCERCLIGPFALASSSSTASPWGNKRGTHGSFPIRRQRGHPGVVTACHV